MRATLSIEHINIQSGIVCLGGNRGCKNQRSNQKHADQTEFNFMHINTIELNL